MNDLGETTIINTESRFSPGRDVMDPHRTNRAHPIYEQRLLSGNMPSRVQYECCWDGMTCSGAYNPSPAELKQWDGVHSARASPLLGVRRSMDKATQDPPGLLWTTSSRAISLLTSHPTRP